MKRRRSLIYLAGAVWRSYLAGKCSPAWPTSNADSSIKNSAACEFSVNLMGILPPPHLGHYTVSCCGDVLFG